MIGSRQEYRQVAVLLPYRRQAADSKLFLGHTHCLAEGLLLEHLSCRIE